jgi:hypothetical protein
MDIVLGVSDNEYTVFTLFNVDWTCSTLSISFNKIES